MVRKPTGAVLLARAGCWQDLLKWNQSCHLGAVWTSASDLSALGVAVLCFVPSASLSAMGIWGTLLREVLRDEMNVYVMHLAHSWAYPWKTRNVLPIVTMCICQWGNWDGMKLNVTAKLRELISGSGKGKAIADCLLRPAQLPWPTLPPLETQDRKSHVRKPGRFLFNFRHY